MEELHLGIGNKQLVNQKGKILFVIFDIPNKKFNEEEICIQRTPLCDRYCYVTTCTKDKTKSTYEKYNNYRRINYKLSKQSDFVQRMIVKIDNQLDKLKKSGKEEIIYFRIHSSGEFYSYEYFLKWVEITNKYRNCKKISFTAYTKSFAILDRYCNEFQQRPNININLSVMYDTCDTYSGKFGLQPYGKIQTLRIISKLRQRYNAKLYYVVPEWIIPKIKQKDYKECKFMQSYSSISQENYNCGQCMICYQDKSIKIYTELRNCSLLNYGRILESKDIKSAIKWYIECATCSKDLRNKFNAFKRLNILCKKNNMFKEQEVVLKNAIEVFKNINSEKFDKGYFIRQLNKATK